MKPSRTVQGTYLAMVTTQTVGSVDGKHRLPAPKQFVAISVLWGILFLLADTGFGKIAARLSVLVLLTGMVLGPFGQVAIKFLNKVTNEFAITPTSGTTQNQPAPPDTNPVTGIPRTGTVA